MRHITALTAVGLAACVSLAGLAATPRAGAAVPHYAIDQQGYQVTVTRSNGGIPHITGADYGSAGYGYGMAFAQDNLCTMAADYVTVDGERSRYFGPAANYTVAGNGTTETNLSSDIFWRGVEATGVVAKLRAVKTGPGALAPGLEQLLQGYVDGYNRHIADVGGPSGVTDPACHGKAWVQPISLETAYLRLYQLIELASGDVVIQGIADAAPPTAGLVPTVPATMTAAQIAGIASGLAAAGAGGPDAGPAAGPAGTSAGGTRGIHPEGGLGSNAVAVGSAGTRDHTHGLLLGNPHFPWQGTERFYQAQIIVPGQMNVEGASLFGVPLVLIGHTQTFAWSHTVSTAYRFTPYQLTLVPGTPTSYLQGTTPTPMTSVTVHVPMADGSTVDHTLYSTRYGPVFDALETVPLPWTAAEAFALGDANADNFRAFNHFFYTDQATSVADEVRILKTYDGIPWVNTIAADSTGHAMYADIGAVPHVADAQAMSCDTALGAVTFTDLRLPILDGSRTDCDWGTDPDSIEPGVFGGNEMPLLQRSDYVTNSNDSYWLANPAQPLTGFPQIIGDTDTARSLRTRLGLIMTKARIDGSDGLGPAGFTRQDMQDLVFNDRQYGAELDKAAAVTMCQGFPGGMAPTSSGAPVAVGTACDVLAAWNGREDLTAVGAVLWREFWERALAVTGGPFSTAFSSSDPVNTPRGLNSADPQVQMAFGDALAAMSAAGVSTTAPLGSVQYVVRNGVKIPLHGGPGDPDGDFNAIYSDVLTGSTIDNSIGSSYVQVVTWTDGSACPDERTILTYSESTDPTSPYYADQTRLFSGKQWLDDGYCAASVAAGAIAVPISAVAPHKPAAAKPKHTVRAAKAPAKVRQPSRTLAFTGLDPLLPVAGVVVIGAGAVLARRRRRG